MLPNQSQNTMNCSSGYMLSQRGPEIYLDNWMHFLYCLQFVFLFLYFLKNIVFLFCFFRRASHFLQLNASLYCSSISVSATWTWKQHWWTSIPVKWNT